MGFAYDYGAVEHEVIGDTLEAATIEPTGHVVFAAFDLDPAMAVGVVFSEVPFDEIVDAPTPRCLPALWLRAAERLRALRRPGATSCVTVQLAALDGARMWARPFLWTLDGRPVSAPFVPGPSYAGSLDERPALEVPGVPYAIAVTPGAHRLEGTVRLLAEGQAARDESFAIDVAVAPGERVAFELRREADGALAGHRPASVGTVD